MSRSSLSRTVRGQAPRAECESQLTNPLLQLLAGLQRSEGAKVQSFKANLSVNLIELIHFAQTAAAAEEPSPESLLCEPVCAGKMNI